VNRGLLSPLCSVANNNPVSASDKNVCMDRYISEGSVSHINCGIGPKF